MPADSKSGSAVSSRIASIDALRGFDMLWITGGEEVIHALYRVYPNAVTGTLAQQFRHVEWAGFHFYDLIFPLFLFIVGLVLPFSLTRRLESGAHRGQLYQHLVRRLLLLLLLGLVYNGLLDFNFHHLRIAGVLQRIAIAYFVASLVLMNTSVKGQAAVTVGILIAYWLIMALVPVPGFGANVLTPQGNLGAYLDQRFLPRPYCCYDYGDNEGIISTLPAVATALLGVLAGHWLRSGNTPKRKFLGLVVVGASCVVVGYGWGYWFPVIKNLWTSSFVLVAGGWSLLLLALFYGIIDVLGFQRWSFYFKVIGLNAITIYLAWRLFDFGAITSVFTHGFIDYFGPLKPLIAALSVLATAWLFLYFLHRQRIYLKV